MDLRPERGEVEHGEEELVEADDEEIPRADQDDALCGADATEIDQDGSEDAAESVERGEDQREHEAALNVDVVGLLIRFVEGVEDALLLTEVLGDGDTADSLFDGGVDICHGFHAALGHFACQRAENGCHAKDDRQECHQQQ
ncbi:MAG: hypothetical protein QM730_09215 [Anaerolineales bacterium]